MIGFICNKINIRVTKGQRGSYSRGQQPRGQLPPGAAAQGATRGAISVKKKIVIFRETRAVFAKCIITMIVIWLLDRVGTCLKKFSGALKNIRHRAPSSHFTSLKITKYMLQ